MDLVREDGRFKSQKDERVLSRPVWGLVMVDVPHKRGENRLAG